MSDVSTVPGVDVARRPVRPGHRQRGGLMLHNARLTLPPALRKGTEVVVDGSDLAAGVRGLTLRAKVGEIPTLELELLIDQQWVDGKWLVDVDPRSRDVLIKLGWTPPKPSVSTGEDVPEAGDTT